MAGQARIGVLAYNIYNKVQQAKALATIGGTTLGAGATVKIVLGELKKESVANVTLAPTLILAAGLMIKNAVMGMDDTQGATLELLKNTNTPLTDEQLRGALEQLGLRISDDPLTPEADKKLREKLQNGDIQQIEGVVTPDAFVKPTSNPNQPKADLKKMYPETEVVPGTPLTPEEKQQLGKKDLESRRPLPPAEPEPKEPKRTKMGQG